MRKELSDSMAQLMALLKSRGVTHVAHTFGEMLLGNAPGDLATQNELIISLDEPEFSEDGHPYKDMFRLYGAHGEDLVGATANDKYAEFVTLVQAIFRSDFAPLIDNIVCGQGAFATMHQLGVMAEHLFPMGGDDGAITNLKGLSKNAGEVFEQNVLDQKPSFAGDALSSTIQSKVTAAIAKMEVENNTAKRLVSARGGVCFLDHNYMKEQLYTGAGAPMKALLTEAINAANIQTPKMSAPTMGLVKMLDPSYSYSVQEANAASYLNTLMPTMEISRCVPYMNVKISSSTASAKQLSFLSKDSGNVVGPIARMSLEEFLGTGYGFYGEYYNAGLPTYRPPDAIDAEGAEEVANANRTVIQSKAGAVSVGMEAFTAPQTLVPMTQPGMERMTGYGSLDKSRPFMTLTSFKTKVSPTRGTMSQQSAELSFVVHDRSRLSQIADILRPATMNKVEFDIEYGWSHPQGGKDSDNVYGQFLNAMRQRQVFTMVKSGYNFTDDGQVNVTVSLVTKASVSVNETDASMTGKHIPGSQAMQTAYEALRIARSAAGDEMAQAGFNELKGTQHIKTLTLASTGDLIKESAQLELQKWIDETNTAIADGGLPNLAALKTAYDTFMQALGESQASLESELEAKMKVITGKSYNDFPMYTSVTINDDEQNNTTVNLMDFSNNPDAKKLLSQSGKVIPLGALIHLFLIKPLMSTGMYDEVQMITYCANVNAAGAAGANLGALPVDVRNLGGNKSATFEKVLKAQYKKWGGQFPVTRMIDYISQNFIEPQTSMCYGVLASGNSNLVADLTKGTVSMKEDSDPGASAAAATTKLQKIYYDGFSGTTFVSAPTPFQTIDLKIILEVGTSNVDDLMKQGVYPTGGTVDRSPKTVLRVHVVDEKAQPTTGISDTLSALKSTKGGLILPPKPREYTGISKSMRKVLSLKPNSIKQKCMSLEGVGILKSMATRTLPADKEEKQEELADIYATMRGEPTTSWVGADPMPDDPCASLYPDGVGPDGSGITLDSTDADCKAFLTRMAQQGIKAGISQLKMVENLEKAIETGVHEPLDGPRAYYLAASPKNMLRFLMRDVPKVTYGQEGSLVHNISIASNVNSKLATIQMLRYQREAQSGGGTSTPNRGLPTRYFPATVSVDMIGNPLIKYTQRFFIDAGTGTTIDNLYAVKSVSHTLTPKEFKTSLEFVAQDAYASFSNLITDQKEATTALDTLVATENERKKAAEAAAEARAAARAARGSRRTGVRNPPPMNTPVPGNTGPNTTKGIIDREFIVWAIHGQTLGQIFYQWAIDPFRSKYNGTDSDWRFQGKKGESARQTLTRGLRFGMNWTDYVQRATGMARGYDGWPDWIDPHIFNENNWIANYMSWIRWGLIPTAGMKDWKRGYRGQHFQSGIALSTWTKITRPEAIMTDGSLTYGSLQPQTDTYPMWGGDIILWPLDLAANRTLTGNPQSYGSGKWWQAADTKYGKSTAWPWAYFKKDFEDRLKTYYKRQIRADPVWGWGPLDHRKMARAIIALNGQEAWPPAWYDPPQHSGVSRDSPY